MSQRTLTVAVRNQIRTTLVLGDSSLLCEVMFDGQPPPACGEWFYAVHPGDWTGQSQDADLEEMIGVMVTVTRRLGYAPHDRYGPEVWAKAIDGLDVQLRKIVVAIHHSHVVRAAANTLMGSDTETEGQFGFTEPLRFLSGGRPEPKGPEWFSADATSGGKYANAGVAQTLTFGLAKRCQDIVGMG